MSPDESTSTWSRPGGDLESKQVFGKRLRELRELRGLTVLAVQNALFNIGRPVSEQSWRNWEAGRALPAMTMAVDLSRVLDCSLDELLVVTAD